MLSLIETRNRHFLAACREIIANLPAGEEINLARVAEEAAQSPAPHYYCTFTYALRMIRLLRHGRLPLRNDRRRLLWEELNIKTAIVMARRGCRLPEALSFVLAGGRPRVSSSLPPQPTVSCSVFVPGHRVCYRF